MDAVVVDDEDDLRVRIITRTADEGHLDSPLPAS
ncbi:hypothetical protein CLV40_12455 [Actinokineospora auranticolor]|uniref:Uncharacterized protein n=1 Tax=Actinokineospora auranticolor TaxID=155976 RepID=A0A2S6GF67_9PSEU|nr:hypothetical protein CLV40_12455 [Actinokineospora auranticolor]